MLQIIKYKSKMRKGNDGLDMPQTSQDKSDSEAGIFLTWGIPQESTRIPCRCCNFCSCCVCYRFRSESSSFVQSPLMVPTSRNLTSTLYSILRTEETSTDNISQSANFISGSKPVHKSNTTDSCYNRDNDVDDRRSPLETEALSNELNDQYNQPQRSISTQGKDTHNAPSKSETLPPTDPVTYPPKLDQSSILSKSSYCPQDKTPPQSFNIFPQTTLICQDISFKQSFPDTEIGFDQGINSSLSRKEVFRVSKPQRDSLDSTSMFTEQNIYFQYSHSDTCCTLPQASSSKTLSKINPIPQARGFSLSPSFTNSAIHKDDTLPQDIGLHESLGTCFQTSTTLPQDSNFHQPYPYSRDGLDQSVPSSKTSKETSLVKMPQSSRLTTITTLTQHTASPPLHTFAMSHRMGALWGQSKKKQTPRVEPIYLMSMPPFFSSWTVSTTSLYPAIMDSVASRAIRQSTPTMSPWPPPVPSSVCMTLAWPPAALPSPLLVLSLRHRPKLWLSRLTRM